jgi:glucose/arabinose dehydrogenase
MRIKLLFFQAIFLCTVLGAQPKFQLKEVGSGFNRPVDIVHCGDNRLFIVEQSGYIWIIDSLGNRLPQPFLDIDSRVQSSGNEQGLLGLAFSPNYALDGYFFVYYTKNNGGDTRVARFTRDPLNSNKALPASEFVIIEEDQPYSNHNGGTIKFSPVDGFLYIGLGDGGSAGDPQGYGQKTNTLLGKILRIDVSDPSVPYKVPVDNPFVGNAAYRPEIWSLGWRNPWRLSFDRQTGDMWVGDVGQNLREEIDFEKAGEGGLNYGWRCYEGSAAYNTTGCLAVANYVMPVYEYLHTNANGCSVTGGFIYRGSKYPDLEGWYLFSDYCSGRWWGTKQVSEGQFNTVVLANLTPYEYSSYGEGIDGTLYVATLSSGVIYRIEEVCSSFQLIGLVSDSVCLGSNAGSITLSVLGVSGTPTFAWSNGAFGAEITNLNPGIYSVVATNGNGCVRVDSFTIGNSSPEAPVLTVAGGNIYCVGDTAVLQVGVVPAGYQLQWYRDGSQIMDMESDYIEVVVGGVYRAFFVKAGCDPVGSNEVFLEFGVVPMVGIRGDSVLCPGFMAELNAVGVPATYTLCWYASGVPIADAIGQRLVVDIPGDYYFIAKGICGEVKSNALNVSKEVVDLPTLSLEGSVLVMADGFVTYSWYLDSLLIAGATSSTYNPLVSGAYRCVAVSAAGCIYSDTIQVELSSVHALISIRNLRVAPNPTKGSVSLLLELNSVERIVLSLKDSKGQQVFLQTIQAQHVARDLDLGILPRGAYFLQIMVNQEVVTKKLIRS